MTKAIDYFDLADGHDNLAFALARIRAKVLVLSYSSDWLFPPEQSKELVRALLQSGVDVTYIGIQSDYGHDAFLLEVDRLGEVAGDFLNSVVRANRPRQPASFAGAIRRETASPWILEPRTRLAS